MEVVVGCEDGRIYCINATGKLVWQYQTGNYVRSSPAIADINGDGYLEVVVGSYDKYIYCINATGGLVWRYQTQDIVFSSPAIADLNDDGYLEVVVGSGDGCVYCLNANGSLLWYYNTTEAVHSSPSVADADSDGYLEVVVGCLANCTYCLDWVDELPPTIEVYAPDNGTWYTTPSVMVSFSIADGEWVRGYTVYLNDSWLLSELLKPVSRLNVIELLQNLSDGWYNLTIVAWDPFNNTSIATVWFGIDTRAPVAEILHPGNNSWLPPTNRVLVQWQARDFGSGLASVWLRLTGKTSGYDSGWLNVTGRTNYTFSGLCNDKYAIQLVTIDRVGYVNSIYFVFVMGPDLLPPEIRILNPSDNYTWINRTPVTVQWQIYDNASGVAKTMLRLTSANSGYDSGWLEVPSNGTLEFTDLCDGNYTLCINASDYEGNNASAVLYFMIDTQPPRVWFVKPDKRFLNTTSVIVAWAYEEPYIDHFLIQLDDNSPISVGMRTGYVFDGLEDGKHEIRIVAYDKAGNFNENATWFVVDTSAPCVQFISPTNLSWCNSAAITIMWDVSDNWLDRVYLWNSSHWIDVKGKTSHALHFHADGRYTLRIKAIDRAGNVATSSLILFVDTTPPIVTLTTPAPNFYNISLLNVSWLIFEKNLSCVLLYVDGQCSNVPCNGSTTLYLPEGNHTIRVVAYDLAGNTGYATTWAVIDHTPPEVRITGLSIEEGNVIVEWVVNDTLSGVACIWLRLGEGSWINVTNLTSYKFSEVPAGSHVLTLRVVDQAGNKAEVHIHIHTTTAAVTLSCLVLVLLSVTAAAAVILAWLLVLRKHRKKRDSLRKRPESTSA